MRPDKDLYFMTITEAVALRASCTRRSVGCVLVDEHYHILSTGYNGPASGLNDCQNGLCARDQAPSGQGLDKCEAIHAEQNALLQCPNTKAIYTAYVSASPCITCLKLLMNTSCQRIVFLEAYPHPKSEEQWKALGREWIHLRPSEDIQFAINQLKSIRRLSCNT